MKLTEQNIPTELAAAYAKLVSSTPGATPESTLSRTRRAAKNPRRRKANTTYGYLRERMLADILKLWRIDPATLEGRNRRYAINSLLRSGTFGAPYFIPATVLTGKILQSEPTSTPDPSPPPYSYRESSNLPTLIEYPDGATSNGQIVTHGFTSGSYFADSLLKWSHAIYDLTESPVASVPFNGIIDHIGAVTIEASNRGSRPMLSVLSRVNRGEQASPPLQSLAPPIMSALSDYWRYKFPASNPPYMHLEYARRVARYLPANILDSSGSALSIAFALRPMLGRGFNNNTSISTRWRGNSTLWLLRDPFAGFWMVDYGLSLPKLTHSSGLNIGEKAAPAFQAMGHYETDTSPWSIHCDGPWFWYYGNIVRSASGAWFYNGTYHSNLGPVNFYPETIEYHPPELS